MSEQNKGSGEVNQNWIILGLAVFFVILALSFLLPFFGYSISYKEIEMRERVTNSMIFGEDAAELVNSISLYYSSSLMLSDLWFHAIKLISISNSAAIRSSVDSITDQIHFLTYRLSVITTVTLFLLPLIVASILDAYWFREKGKWTFFLPSPTKHRFGQKLGTLSIVFSYFSLIAFPFVVIPAIFLVFGIVLGIFGVWLWIANTQKRI